MILSSPKSLFTVEPSSTSSSSSRTCFGNIFPSLLRLSSWQWSAHSPEMPSPRDKKRGSIYRLHCNSSSSSSSSSNSHDSARRLPSIIRTTPSSEPAFSPAEASPDWQYATQGLSLSPFLPHLLSLFFIIPNAVQPTNIRRGGNRNRSPSALYLHIRSADQPATFPPALHPQHNIPSSSAAPRPFFPRIPLSPIRPSTISFPAYRHLFTFISNRTTTTVSPPPHPSLHNYPAIPRHSAIIAVY